MCVAPIIQKSFKLIIHGKMLSQIIHSFRPKESQLRVATFYALYYPDRRDQLATLHTCPMSNNVFQLQNSDQMD